MANLEHDHLTFKEEGLLAVGGGYPHGLLVHEARHREQAVLVLANIQRGEQLNRAELLFLHKAGHDGYKK